MTTPPDPLNDVATITAIETRPHMPGPVVRLTHPATRKGWEFDLSQLGVLHSSEESPTLGFYALIIGTCKLQVGDTIPLL